MIFLTYSLGHPRKLFATIQAVMKNLAKTLTIVSYILNVPAMFIWATIILQTNNYPVGEPMAAWLAANFSALGIVIMWLMMPSSALIFGLGSYAMEGKKAAILGVVALSTILLLGLAVGGARAR